MERFKANSLFSGVILTVAVVVGFSLIFACATAPKKAQEGPVATIKACSSAEVISVNYFLGKSKFSGGDKLHIKLGLKNISDKPKRYRVSIDLPDGGSGGGFYPRTGKPPVLKPGQEMVQTFPMFSDRIPESVTIRIEEI
jgi:hypothetical protein